MPRTKSNKPKRNPWTDPSPYGTYQGESGNPEMWKSAFEYATFSREKSLGILINTTQTLYEILQVPSDCSIEQIKTGYRKLAMIHHPDKGGDRAIFEKITAAYSILINL